MKWQQLIIFPIPIFFMCTKKRAYWQTNKQTNMLIHIQYFYVCKKYNKGKLLIYKKFKQKKAISKTYFCLYKSFFITFMHVL